MMKRKNDFKEIVLYFAVSAIATFTEWLIFFGVEKIINLHYIFSVIIAYVSSTFVNWLMGRRFVFKNSGKSIGVEVAEIYITAVFGLLLNLLMMYIFSDILSLGKMSGKVMATFTVFFFNFAVRKFLIYKKQCKKE